MSMRPEDSTSTIDPDFAKDVEAAIDSHRESLDALAVSDRNTLVRRSLARLCTIEQEQSPPR
jgi:hypothetical protein